MKAIKMDYSSLHSVSQFDPDAKMFSSVGYGWGYSCIWLWFNFLE